jgi:hypothetical protein
MTQPLTPEQSNTIARTLYDPTIRRMNILCQSLIQTTGNGDFALWAPLTVMEAQFSDLKWSDARAPQRFLTLIVLALRRYAEKIEVHQLAVVAAMTAGVPLPPFAAWSDSDTVSLYDEIDARFPAVEAAVDGFTATPEPTPPTEPAK